MNPVKKRQKLDDEQTEKIFAELDGAQEKIEALDQEENEKVIEITKQYNQLRKPHLTQRNEIIAKIPDFWSKAFHNHPILGGLLVEEDFEIFKSLLSLEVTEAEDVKSGFKISLTFKKNPFFTNKTLSKEYKYDEAGQLKITASQINWKKGKDPTVPSEEGSKGGKRTASELDDSLSFFCWFGEEEEDELAEVIRTDFWPNPVKYYHNLVEFEDDDDDDEEDDEDDGEEGEGEEDDEEEGN